MSSKGEKLEAPPFRGTLHTFLKNAPSAQESTQVAQDSRWSLNFKSSVADSAGESFMKGVAMMSTTKSSNKPARNRPIPQLPPGDPPDQDKDCLPDWEGEVLWKRSSGGFATQFLTLRGTNLIIRRVKEDTERDVVYSVTQMWKAVTTGPFTTASPPASTIPAAVPTGAPVAVRFGVTVTLVDGAKTLNWSCATPGEAEHWVQILSQRIRGVRHYADSLREGNLMKRSGKGKWNARWFVLRGGTLFYYTLPSQLQDATEKLKEKAISMKDVKDVTVLQADDPHTFCLAFELQPVSTTSYKGGTPKNTPKGKPEKAGKTIILDAAQHSNLQAWYAVLSVCLRDFKEVVGWGEKEPGTDRRILPLRGVAALMHTNVLQISCGEKHAAALMADGGVYTWGYGSEGQLGLGDDVRRTEPTKVAALVGTRIKQLAASDMITCAICEVEGHVYLWGTVAPSAAQWVPRRVQGGGLQRARHVACGPYHVAAVSQGGEIFTWGEGFAGQLGLGDTRARTEPTRVVIASGKWKKGRCLMVACGVWHTLALTEYGQVLAWGSSEQGQLGLGNKAPSFEPVPVSGFADESQLGDQPIKYVCAGQMTSGAISAKGNAFIWGKGEGGQLGLGKTNLGVKVPTKIEGLGDVLLLSLSVNSSAAVTREGSLYTWGKACMVYAEDEAGETKVTKDVFSPLCATRLDRRVLQAACGGSFCLALCSSSPISSLSTSPMGRVNVSHLIDEHHSIEEMGEILAEAENLARSGIITTHECEEQRRQIFQATMSSTWGHERKGWTDPLELPPKEKQRILRSGSKQRSLAMVPESVDEGRGSRIGFQVGRYREDARLVADRAVKAAIKRYAESRAMGSGDKPVSDVLDSELKTIRGALEHAFDLSLPPPINPQNLQRSVAPKPATKVDEKEEQALRKPGLPRWLDMPEGVPINLRTASVRSKMVRTPKGDDDDERPASHLALDYLADSRNLFTLEPMVSDLLPLEPDTDTAEGDQDLSVATKLIFGSSGNGANAAVIDTDSQEEQNFHSPLNTSLDDTQPIRTSPINLNFASGGESNSLRSLPSSQPFQGDARRGFAAPPAPIQGSDIEDSDKEDSKEYSASGIASEHAGNDGDTSVATPDAAADDEDVESKRSGGEVSETSPLDSEAASLDNDGYASSKEEVSETPSRNESWNDTAPEKAKGDGFTDQDTGAEDFVTDAYDAGEDERPEERTPGGTLVRLPLEKDLEGQWGVCITSPKSDTGDDLL